jgi:hypothetical protein
MGTVSFDATDFLPLGTNAPASKARRVRLTDRKAKATTLTKRAAPGTAPDYLYNKAWREAHKERIAREKAEWARKNRLRIRVYGRIWMRMKRGGPTARYRRGTASSASKLTDAQVIEMRARRAMGVTQKQLAMDFGIAQSRVSKIINGEAWTHLLPKEGV